MCKGLRNFYENIDIICYSLFSQCTLKPLHFCLLSWAKGKPQRSTWYFDFAIYTHISSSQVFPEETHTQHTHLLIFYIYIYLGENQLKNKISVFTFDCRRRFGASSSQFCAKASAICRPAQMSASLSMSSSACSAPKRLWQVCKNIIYN